MNALKSFFYLGIAVVFQLVMISCEPTTKVEPPYYLGDVSADTTNAAIYVGDSQKKTLSIIKAILKSDRNFSTNVQEYHAPEINENVIQYDILYNRDFVMQFYFAGNKLRCILTMFGKIHKKRLSKFGDSLVKHPNTYQRVNKGVFKHLASPNKEYGSFLASQALGEDSVNITFISWANPKDYETLISPLKDKMISVTESKGIPISVSIIE